MENFEVILNIMQKFNLPKYMVDEYIASDGNALPSKLDTIGAVVDLFKKAHKDLSLDKIGYTVEVINKINDFYNYLSENCI